MFIAPYQGLFDYLGVSRRGNRCGLTILPQPEGKAMVILSELTAQTSKSLTDHYLRIANEVYEQFLSHIPVQNITWIEHYNREHHSQNAEPFAEVSLTWDPIKKAFNSSEHRPCNKAMVEAMLESIELFSDELNAEPRSPNRYVG